MIPNTLIILTLLNIFLVHGLKYRYKEITSNQIYTDDIDKKEMRMFSLKLDSDVSEKDLVVDAKIESLNKDHAVETPIVVLSLVRNLFLFI